MKTITGSIIMLWLAFALTTTTAFAAGNNSDKTQKKIEKQAKAIAKQYKKEGYSISGTVLPMEQVALNHLQKLQDGKYLDYETKVSAPTYAIGQQKCLGDAQNFMVRLVFDSIRYRYDQAYGGDEVKKNKKEVSWTDRFFSAFQQVGAIDIGGMIHPSFTIFKKVKRSDLTEYRMFFLYSPDFINSDKEAITRAIQKALREVDEGVEFGEKVQKFINNGLK
ncbi:MAG: hypothetical protein WCK84_13455 [Bacteroidota bacterium]